ncbi:MAG: serine/threonine protein kinase [Planctomycetales bacterium]|nr:serine/threonine protein kinase [Planctomycetales bacterium]
MATLTLSRSKSVQRLDDLVEAFETAWQSGIPNVRSFIDELDPIADRWICIELLCVDLFYRWDSECRKTVSGYLDDFPQLLSSQDAIDELAHEEYRLRRDTNNDADEFASTFGIDTSSWATDTESRLLEDTGIESLSSEFSRLTDSIQDFPTVGDKVGDFELVEELGRGTFGIVFLAKQGELEDRFVALKLTTIADIEARYLARLQHTNIVPIYSIHRFDGLFGICMPFVGRKTLAENNTTPRTESELLQIVLQLAQGLEHAHQRGIVHRDLKPANVLLGDDGVAMLLDFNLSADVVNGGKSNVMVGGTLPYLAPEHLRAIQTGTDVDQRSDVYSLGVILFELLTGTLPFQKRHGSFNSVIEGMIDDRENEPNWLLLNGRSPGTIAIVKKMICADLQSR